MKKFVAVLFLIAALFTEGKAQSYVVKGRVEDKTTKVALPFVNVIVTGYPKLGATADIDGNFKLSSLLPITSLSFSYVGYRDTSVAIQHTTHAIHITFYMQQAAYQLNEVNILPGINPALRIIKDAIKNKDSNNPEKVHSFAYYSYNKMYCTSDMKAPADSTNLFDSATYIKRKNGHTSKKNYFYTFFKTQYLFLVESVSKRRFLYPNHSYEEVLASRTSGLKNSPFALLATQMQSFSFYPENITILGDDYLNPISKAGFKRYYYLLQDTLYQGKDTVFIISFHPKKKKNFNGMQGVLYINTNRYAIQNVIAQPILPDNTISIHIQQKYEFINHTQWFPVQLNTDWVYNNITVKDTTIKETKTAISPNDEHNKIKVVTRSYIKDIVLDTALRKRDFGRVEVEIAKNASAPADSIWNKYRHDTLNAKEKKTYRVIDSIGKAHHFARKLKWFETLATGKLRTGFVNWDLNKILTYNGYEGFRLGAGLHTNDAISRFVSLGGYGAYGFKDIAFKYGADIGFLLNPYSQVKLNLAYKNDVTEMGGVSFYNDTRPLFSDQSFYNYFITNMDKIEMEKASFSFDALQYFRFNLFGDEQTRQATSAYQFGVTDNNVTVLYNRFNFSELGLGIRFAYGEKFLKSPLGMLSLGTKYPVVLVKITKGFNGLLNGAYNYWKYDLKITKTIRIPQVGFSSIEILAGYVNGNVPLTMLYNSRATYIPYSVVADNSFETMRINEFAYSRYINLFYSHDFQSYLFHFNRFSPQPEIIFAAGWGAMDNKMNQYNYPFKTMDKGYYESGLAMNNLIKISFARIGIGGFYRYGPYAFSKPADNFVFKFTVNLFQ